MQQMLYRKYGYGHIHFYSPSAGDDFTGMRLAPSIPTPSSHPLKSTSSPQYQPPGFNISPHNYQANHSNQYSHSFTFTKGDMPNPSLPAKVARLVNTANNINAPFTSPRLNPDFGFLTQKQLAAHTAAFILSQAAEPGKLASPAALLAWLRDHDSRNSEIPLTTVRKLEYELNEAIRAAETAGLDAFSERRLSDEDYEKMVLDIMHIRDAAATICRLIRDRLKELGWVEEEYWGTDSWRYHFNGRPVAKLCKLGWGCGWREVVIEQEDKTEGEEDRNEVEKRPKGKRTTPKNENQTTG